MVFMPLLSHGLFNSVGGGHLRLTALSFGGFPPSPSREELAYPNSEKLTYCACLGDLAVELDEYDHLLLPLRRHQLVSADASVFDILSRALSSPAPRPSHAGPSCLVPHFLRRFHIQPLSGKWGSPGVQTYCWVHSLRHLRHKRRLRAIRTRSVAKPGLLGAIQSPYMASTEPSSHAAP